MRKTIFTMLVLALSSIALQARPVDQATASRLGQSFVKANFEFTRQSDQLNLVQTAYSDRGDACYSSLTLAMLALSSLLPTTTIVLSSAILIATRSIQTTWLRLWSTFSKSFAKG